MNKAKGGTNASAFLREMARVGIPLDLSVCERDLEIEQSTGPLENTFFDLPSGRAGCVLYLSIINQTSIPITTRDVELRPPWSSSEFEWLPDPREMGIDPLNYRFPGRGGPEFPRDQTLNHVLLSHGVLRPGCPIEGWLLGIGRPLPRNLFGGPVDVTLVITGYDHNVYAATLTVLVDLTLRRGNDLSRKVPKAGPSHERARKEPQVSES